MKITSEKPGGKVVHLVDERLIYSSTNINVMNNMARLAYPVQAEICAHLPVLVFKCNSTVGCVVMLTLNLNFSLHPLEKPIPDIVKTVLPEFPEYMLQEPSLPGFQYLIFL